MLRQRDMDFFTVFLIFAAHPLIEAGNETSCNSECAFIDINSHLGIASHVIETVKQKMAEFKTADAVEGGNQAINNSECLILDIMSHLGIASQTIDTVKQMMLKDLKQVCKNCNDNECEKCEDISCETRPLDCSDIYLNGERRDGLYDVWPESEITKGPLRVYCDMESDGGGWTVIQRRGDYGRSEDYFFKEWNAYKAGFGDKMQDFWIGNDNLFALTNQRHYKLRVNMTSWEWETAYATYDEFWISDENLNYTLHVNGYNGTAGDSMVQHNGSMFSTKDRENPKYDLVCAAVFKGGWWYHTCVSSNLNGLYLRGNNSRNHKGVVWRSFKGSYHSLRDTVMKIRPLRFRS